jgi:hypothetical protein
VEVIRDSAELLARGYPPAVNGAGLALLGLMVVVTLANLAILALTLKLYTEYFKDRSAGGRQVVVHAVSGRPEDQYNPGGP